MQTMGERRFLLICFLAATDKMDMMERLRIKINVLLTDFPILIFLENDIIKYHISGTISTKKLKEIIKDLHFN